MLDHWNQRPEPQLVEPVEEVPARCNLCFGGYDRVCSDQRDGSDIGYCLGTGPNGENLTEVVAGNQMPPAGCPKRAHRVQ